MNGLFSSIFRSHVSLPEGTYVFIRTLSLNNQDSTMTPWGFGWYFWSLGWQLGGWPPVAMMMNSPRGWWAIKWVRKQEERVHSFGESSFVHGFSYWILRIFQKYPFQSFSDIQIVWWFNILLLPTSDLGKWPSQKYGEGIPLFFINQFPFTHPCVMSTIQLAKLYSVTASKIQCLLFSPVVTNTLPSSSYQLIVRPTIVWCGNLWLRRSATPFSDRNSRFRNACSIWISVMSCHEIRNLPQID